MSYHPLLVRQIRRAFGTPGAAPPGLVPFFDLIDAAYRQSDQDRRLTDRAMFLSSAELTDEIERLVAERQADEERVREAVLRLGDDQRQVIILRFVEELDYREVAEILGKSVAAVRVIQHRALCALRKMMKVEEVA